MSNSVRLAMLRSWLWWGKSGRLTGGGETAGLTVAPQTPRHLLSLWQRPTLPVKREHSNCTGQSQRPLQMVPISSGHMMREDWRANRSYGTLFPDGDRKERNAFTAVLTAYYVHESILVSSSKNNTPGTVAAIGGRNLLGMWQFR